MRKNEVIIWRPFPSPSAKNSDTASFTPFLSTGAVASKPKTEAELEEATVERWARLADLALGNEVLPAEPTKNKKKRVA